MKLKTNKIYATMSVAILLSLSASAFARDGNHHQPPLPNGWSYYAPTSTNNSTSSATFLSASLVGQTGFAGTGSVSYRANGVNGSLQARIQLPVDGATILDSNTAASSSYTLTISSGSSVLTSCTLNLSEIGFTYSNTTPVVITEVANYQVSVYEQNSTTTATIGTCSVAGSTTAVLPVLAATDVVNVYLSPVTPTSQAILSGPLGATVTHHR